MEANSLMDATEEIPEVDRQRLEDMVQSYRHSIYNLYRLAHTQGEIDSANEIKGKIAA